MCVMEKTNDSVRGKEKQTILLIEWTEEKKAYGRKWTISVLTNIMCNMCINIIY